MNDTYTEKVRQEILAFRPDEVGVLDEEALRKVAAYFKANDYSADELVQLQDDRNMIYFAYDVLKFTSQMPAAD